MATIGYGRVSTRDQNPDSQRDALRAAGCDKLFIDHGRSGKLASRPELDKALAALNPGDTLVITRLSRLARSITNLLALCRDLDERKVALRMIDQPELNRDSPTGRFLFNIMASVDEFQRELIQENTYEGLASAKARGRVGGRKPGLDARRVKAAKRMLGDGASVSEIAATLKVSRATVYRHLSEADS